MAGVKEVFLYRNKSDQTQALIGFGEVEPGKIIKTTKKFDNPNFEQVEETKAKSTVKTKENKS